MDFFLFHCFALKAKQNIAMVMGKKGIFSRSLGNNRSLSG
jgi:hypothetical protein